MATRFKGPTPTPSASCALMIVGACLSMAAGQCPSLVRQSEGGECFCRLQNYFTEVELYCENLGVVGSVPSFAASNLALELVAFRRNTVIRRLQDDAFRSLVVRTLQLKSVGLTTISEHAFRGLEDTLEELYLQANRLRAVPSRALAALTRLRYLGLDRNEIAEVGDGAFRNLAALSLLYLTNNRVVRLSSGAFDGLRALTRINLDGNRLRHLAAGLFNQTTRLVEISARDNAIASLDRDAFRTLTELQRLDLSRNEIGELPERLFRTNSDLLYLTVSGNELTRLPADLFGASARLLQLDLSENRIEEIRSSAFRNLPELRSLRLNDNRIAEFDWTLLGYDRSLRNLYLSNNRIRSVAMAAETTLNYLDLSRNDLTELADGWLGEVKVVSLDLSSNRIGSVSPTAFRGSYFLGTLRLSHNNISWLAPDALGDAFALDSLYLDDNRLRAADLNVVRYLPYLTTLDASRNLIADIPGGLFRANDQIETLDLSQNRLVGLRQADLAGLRSVQYLYLHDNAIDGTITHDFFRRNGKLHTIDFRRNRIRAVEKYAFFGLDRLVHVDLSQNELSYLSSGCLYYAKNLRSVNLTGNHLTTVSKYYFDGMAQLAVFDVSDNRIRRLDPRAFVGGRALTDVRIGRNPYDCSCDMQRLVMVPFITDVLEIRCRSPESYAGRRALDFLCRHCHLDSFCYVTATTEVPETETSTGVVHESSAEWSSSSTPDVFSTDTPTAVVRVPSSTTSTEELRPSVPEVSSELTARVTVGSSDSISEDHFATLEPDVFTEIISYHVTTSETHSPLPATPSASYKTRHQAAEYTPVQTELTTPASASDQKAADVRPSSPAAEPGSGMGVSEWSEPGRHPILTPKPENTATSIPSFAASESHHIGPNEPTTSPIPVFTPDSDGALDIEVSSTPHLEYETEQVIAPSFVVSDSEITPAMTQSEVQGVSGIMATSVVTEVEDSHHVEPSYSEFWSGFQPVSTSFDTEFRSAVEATPTSFRSLDSTELSLVTSPSVRERYDDVSVIISSPVLLNPDSTREITSEVTSSQNGNAFEVIPSFSVSGDESSADVMASFLFSLNEHAISYESSTQAGSEVTSDLESSESWFQRGVTSGLIRSYATAETHDGFDMPGKTEDVVQTASTDAFPEIIPTPSSKRPPNDRSSSNATGSSGELYQATSTSLVPPTTHESVPITPTSHRSSPEITPYLYTYFSEISADVDKTDFTSSTRSPSSSASASPLLTPSSRAAREATSLISVMTSTDITEVTGTPSANNPSDVITDRSAADSSPMFTPRYEERAGAVIPSAEEVIPETGVTKPDAENRSTPIDADLTTTAERDGFRKTTAPSTSGEDSRLVVVATDKRRTTTERDLADRTSGVIQSGDGEPQAVRFLDAVTDSVVVDEDNARSERSQTVPDVFLKNIPQHGLSLYVDQSEEAMVDGKEISAKKSVSFLEMLISSAEHKTSDK